MSEKPKKEAKPKKERVVARVPEDLRAFTHLTMAEVAEVQALRARGKTLRTKIENLPEVQKGWEREIEEAEERETAILDAASERLPKAPAVAGGAK